MRGGGKDASAEAMQSKVGAYINYLQSIRTAITRMQLMNDCKETQISFQSGADATCTPSGSYGNANSPTDCRCHVFHPNGGGVPYRSFADFNLGAGSLYFVGKSNVKNIGTHRSDLLAFTSKGLGSGAYSPEDKAYCMAYNKLSNDVAVNMNSPTATVYSAPNFAGTYADDFTEGSAFAGVASVCHPYISGGFLSYFVLLER